MKLVKKLTILILVLVCFASTVACGESGEQEVNELGCPSSQRFEAGELSRCVWDMKLWDGVLYIGGGDYDKNTGPVSLWAYNVKEKQWDCSASLPDEAITRFLVLNGQLVAPGIDPTESWELGNYYKLENDEWKVHRVLPNAVHTFDAVQHNGIVIVGIGTDGKTFPALISYDDGTTFSAIPFYKNGVLFELSAYEYSRTYELFVFNDRVYALVYNKQFDGEYNVEMYVFDGGAFNFVKGVDNFCKFGNISVNMLNAKGQFKDSFFISSDYLYVSDNLNQFDKVKLPQDENASQFRVIDGKLYVLSYKPHEKEEDKYKIRMYVSDSGVDNFKQVFSFDYDVHPLCFEKDGDVFYVGMGTKTITHQNNGMVLEVRL
ncbi:MAG: hypothetical protein IJC07_03020 [Clostridia bacterium]|nr:hypothetical protein [Clostridia bacterium]